MASVNVTISGRQFRMACEDGQEEHLKSLAKDLDDRIAALRANFGEIGDNRLIVMAAMTVVDELAETTAKLRRLEAENVALRDARASADARAKTAQDAIVGAFNAAAERLEGIARKLNPTAGGGTAPG